MSKLAQTTPRAAELVGRRAELARLHAFLDDGAVHGGAQMISGEPGVGKTALLDAAARAAAADGRQVLRGAGVEFEADVGYAGLNQILFPLHAEFYRLSPGQRDALSAALGFGEGHASDRLVVATAALELLRRAAADRPLLVIVDDVQWLDRSSATVFGFLARRLAGSRVCLLAATRSGAPSFFEPGLTEYEVQPLGELEASRLMQAHFPALAPRVRDRLLSEAQGNPLALVELPAALSGPQRAALRALPAVLPLSRRLQALFASRVAELPAPTRQLLLIAALEGTGDLALVQAAGHLDDLLPAEQARLIHVDEGSHRLVFRHPLVRSTVVEASTSTGRRRAHATLAGLLLEQPDRRAWHLAEACVEPDALVAELLEATAHRSLRRGDAVGAVTAMLRSADLSPGRPERSRRLAEAAYVCADVTGELRNVSQLLVDARRADPEQSASLQAAVAASYLLLNGDGDIATAHRLLVTIIEHGAEQLDAEDNTLVEALHNLLEVCLYGRRAELWEPFYAALSRLAPAVPPVLELMIDVLGDPARTAARAIDRLETAINGLSAEDDPTRIERIATAALFLDRAGGCREALWRVVQDGRQGGAITSAINALIVLCSEDYMTGQWDEAQRLTEEGVALCEANGYRLLVWPFRLTQSLLAAARGDVATTEALTDALIGWGAPRGVRAAQIYAWHARALAALGRGDFEYAFQQLSLISAAGTLDTHENQALWVCMDLVEAAVHTNRLDQAAAHASALEAAGIATLSPRLALLAGAASAMVAADDDYRRAFTAVLAVPGVERWPFELARVQLAFGERLRRARAIADSRPYLTAALSTFRRLGAAPWCTRASSELRAAGQASVSGSGGAAPALTTQEYEIAMLAASGLTNKQIAERVFLSHRTVGAHLYQIFPKLGVSSRAALRDALASVSPVP